MNGITLDVFLKALETGALAVIVWFLLKQQAKQREADDVRNQKTLELMMEVVKSNTAAMTEVRVSNDGIKEAVEGIRDFVAQVDRRLTSGQVKFADHEARIGNLERSGG